MKQPVNSVAGTLTAEEFIEGIMANLFWYEEAGAGAGWEAGAALA